MQEIYAGIISAVVGFVVGWLKERKHVKAILQSTRLDKIKGIGSAVAPAVAEALETAASKTAWKWDDLLVAEVNRRLIGQRNTETLDPDEKAILLEAFPAPPVIKDGPKLDQGTLDKLRAGS